VSGWWRSVPHANVGIRTGTESGLVVLDVDGQAGWQALQDLAATCGPLTACWTRTGSGGWHAYLAHPVLCDAQVPLGPIFSHAVSGGSRARGGRWGSSACRASAAPSGRPLADRHPGQFRLTDQLRQAQTQVEGIAPSRAEALVSRPHWDLRAGRHVAGRPAPGSARAHLEIRSRLLEAEVLAAHWERGSTSATR
jgi:Bifunctional DNA primase/polymerase, N-terminal